MVNNRWARLSQNEKAELLGIYTSMGYNDLASIIAHYNSCGGKLKADGGPVTNTAQYKSDAYLYTPPVNVGAPIEIPLRYKPLPDYGDYVPQRTTGIIENMPIELNLESPERGYGVLIPENNGLVEDLFSKEAKERRALKQRYAESSFNDRAKSKVGAQGAWQIMPITLKDYLGRGKGKAGDLNDPEYNRKVRDWVMEIIPRDLQEFWSDLDSDRAKLAKLYAAYNWGAGNLRSFLRKKQKAGVDISDPDNWVDDLNPETRRYVKYLAFDEDIPDSIYTNSAFEDAARAKGYMAEGGRLFRNGGDTDDDGHTVRLPWWQRVIQGATMAENPAVMTASGMEMNPDGTITYGKDNEGVRRLRNNLAVIGASGAAGSLLSGIPGAINWLSSPANQIIAGKIAMPLLGGATSNEAIRQYTPWNSWADMLVKGTGLDEVMDYALLPREQQDFVYSGAEMTNPLFYAPYGKFGEFGASAIGKAERGVGRFTDSARKYVEGVKDRLAESVIRMADTVKDEPLAATRQIFSPNGLRYILDPKASHLAYELPYKYSGSDYLAGDAHAGDLVDQWIGKSPVEGGVYDYNRGLVPEEMMNAIKRLYPNKVDKIPLVQFETSPSEFFGEMPSYELGVRRSAMSGSVHDASGRSIVDPGRYGSYLRKAEDGSYYFDNWDLWKFHPESQRPNGLKTLFYKPAKFVDDRGTPILFNWKTPVKIDAAPEAEASADWYWSGMNYGDFDDYINFGILDKIPGDYYVDVPYNEPFLKNGGKIHIKPKSQEKLFGDGGPTPGMNPLTNLFRAAKEKYLTDYANRGQMYSYPYAARDLVQNYILSPYNYKRKFKLYTDKSRDDAIDDYINGSAQRRALFSKYYGLDNTNFKPDDYIVESRYRPSNSTNPDAKYYTYKTDDVFDRSQSFLDNNGKVKIDFGNDENGNYISIYDVWDLAPFGSRVGNQMGGAPIEMYDRFYESENPRVYYRLKGIASEDAYASGGKIHIKPENRGKFTALKKRTGHSASWFKAHGTPAQKKMAVFALNAKKWKHGDGGPLREFDNISDIF